MEKEKGVENVTRVIEDQVKELLEEMYTVGYFAGMKDARTQKKYRWGNGGDIK